MQLGRCLCGDIAFGVEGEPRDIINCHCHFCQRATGSAYLVETTFLKDRFHLRAGRPETYAHTSAGSGKAIEIRFCRRCGTKTHMTFERFPDIVGVFSGTFDTADWFTRTRENSLHFFLSNAPVGTIMPTGFEVYDAHFWASEGAPATPTIFDTHTLVTEEIRQASLARLRR